MLQLPTAVWIIHQVASALDAAHGNGLIHRDVKPGNIMVSEHGWPRPKAYLTDFGLSKNPSQDSVALTKQGQFVGTTAYTAPEEILAQPRDHRVDVYSLGCVMYETLVGVPPFVRERDLDVLYAHIGDARPMVSQYRSDVPPGTDEVIAKAMAISPDDRFHSCTEFIDAIAALLPPDQRPDAAAPAGAGAPPPPPPLVGGGPPPPPPAVAPPLRPAGSAPPPPPPAPDVAPPPAFASSAPPPPPGPPPPPAPGPPPPPEPGGGAPSGPLKLVVMGGPAAGREILLTGDEVPVGRLVTLDGALSEDREISRQQARLFPGPDGAWHVEDLGSANGTFVNGQRLASPRALSPGDEVRIGTTALAVEAVPEAPAPAEPSPEPIADIQATRPRAVPDLAPTPPAEPVPDAPPTEQMEPAPPAAAGVPGADAAAAPAPAADVTPSPGDTPTRPEQATPPEPEPAPAPPEPEPAPAPPEPEPEPPAPAPPEPEPEPAPPEPAPALTPPAPPEPEPEPEPAPAPPEPAPAAAADDAVSGEISPDPAFAPAPPVPAPSADDAESGEITPDPAFAAAATPAPTAESGEITPAPAFAARAGDAAAGTGRKLVLRLEIDLDSGGVVDVAVEGGGSVRVVPDGSGWRIESR